MVDSRSDVDSAKALAQQVFNMLKDEQLPVAMNAAVNATAMLCEHFQVDPVVVIEIFAACVGLPMLLAPAAPEDFDTVQKALSQISMDKNKLN